MEKSVRKALEARFPDEAVKSRPGSFGKTLNYVEGAAVVARLNDVLDGEWSFVIAENRELPTGEILVLGRLTVLGQITKEAFGRSSPAISRETGEVLSAGDAYKSAATDSLKKCASLVGLGLYLHSDDLTDAPDEKPAEEQRERPAKPTAAPRDRLTQKQLSAIWSVGRGLKLSADAVRKRSVEMFNVQPEQLSKGDASAFISTLAAEIDGRRAA